MKDNAIRGEMLEFLKYVYPEGASLESMIDIFFQYHKDIDVKESLEYLTDKEYILKKELPHPYRERNSLRWFKILPKGIDLLEGNIPEDPGIAIPRR